MPSLTKKNTVYNTGRKAISLEIRAQSLVALFESCDLYSCRIY